MKPEVDQIWEWIGHAKFIIRKIILDKFYIEYISGGEEYINRNYQNPRFNRTKFYDGSVKYLYNLNQKSRLQLVMENNVRT